LPSWLSEPAWAFSNRMLGIRIDQNWPHQFLTVCCSSPLMRV
jgi:hypothetical protein